MATHAQPTKPDLFTVIVALPDNHAIITTYGENTTVLDLKQDVSRKVNTLPLDRLVLVAGDKEYGNSKILYSIENLDEDGRLNVVFKEPKVHDVDTEEAGPVLSAPKTTVKCNACLKQVRGLCISCNKAFCINCTKKETSETDTIVEDKEKPDLELGLAGNRSLILQCSSCSKERNKVRLTSSNNDRYQGCRIFIALVVLLVVVGISGMVVVRTHRYFSKSSHP
ncbi:hypothetical protein HDU81_007489 [Chytriomyces hyalinus]|nr:hypothetical protein HDU81_007489 [Chytriomyces hyalinus]